MEETLNLWKSTMELFECIANEMMWLSVAATDASVGSILYVRVAKTPCLRIPCSRVTRYRFSRLARSVGMPMSVRLCTRTSASSKTNFSSPQRFFDAIRTRDWSLLMEPVVQDGCCSLDGIRGVLPAGPFENGFEGLVTVANAAVLLWMDVSRSRLV